MDAPIIDYDQLRRFVRTALDDGSVKARRLSMEATGGSNPDLIRNLLAGTKPNLDSVLGIAKALDVAASTFISGWNLPGFQRKRWLLVNATVEAGIWREQVEMPPDEWSEIEVVEDKFVGHDHGFIVRGRSMDKTLPPGTILRCVDMISSHAEWGSGDYVIVERKRGDLVELTCKRLSMRPDGNWELRAESYLEEFREPIFIGRPLPPGSPSAFDIGDNDIRVRGLVLDAYLPLMRRKVRAHLVSG